MTMENNAAAERTKELIEHVKTEIDAGSKFYALGSGGQPKALNQPTQVTEELRNNGKVIWEPSMAALEGTGTAGGGSESGRSGR